MQDASNQPESAVQLARGVWLAQPDARFSFSRASGPGGQAVNKLSTKAELRVSVRDIRGLDGGAVGRLRQLAGQRLTQNDEIIITAQTFRSQLDNKLECIERLRHLVGRALIAPKPRKKKKPTRGMIERRLESKRRRSQKKDLRRSRRDGFD